MGADEAGTLAALEAHRAQPIDPGIVRDKGRIVTLKGDSILAEFPSAVEAARPGEAGRSRFNWPQLAGVAVPRNPFREILRRADCQNHAIGWLRKGIEFPWRWDDGSISTNLDVIWEMSAIKVVKSGWARRSSGWDR